MDKDEHSALVHRLRSIFERYAQWLSEDDRNSVENFIEVAEVEMACESFVLSVLEEQVRLTDDSKKGLRNLALALQLDRESVFRADFWAVAEPVFTTSDCE